MEINYCVQDGGPPPGARGGAPDVSGAGQVGFDILGLGVSQGGAPLVLEKTGRVADRDLLRAKNPLLTDNFLNNNMPVLILGFSLYHSSFKAFR